MEKYDHQKIERKWQDFWERERIFQVSDKSKKKKFYCLDMFPYPSAQGLHVGHLRGYTFSDVLSKKRKMEDFEVLHPMGFDSFGLPAENYAVKTGIHPAQLIKESIANFRRQLKMAGFGYDWEREIFTSSPEYYKWTQWIFLLLLKKGMAYQKESPVNWCPSCKTVLANEQVIEGKCERCKTPVEKRFLKQWFFRITEYAERLLKDLDKLDWPSEIKTLQRNWIGKSEGAEIKFIFKDFSDLSLEIFTTRIDTLFGCTYVVISPEHPIIKKIVDYIENKDEVEKYIRLAKGKMEIERKISEKEKTGVLLKGLRVVNPVNQEEVPVFVADYVLMDYGTGAVMAVPAHDQRDFLFAKKYNLPVKKVIKPLRGDSNLKKGAFEEDGVLVNSGKFSGMSSSQARKEIEKYLKEKRLATHKVYYKMRDWLVSRQRYWGAPIPIIFCPVHGAVPVPQKDLPVILPDIKDFKPTGTEKSPLSKSKSFVETRCPICGRKAERETDTMDTFVDSSWYYLRYADSHNKERFASPEKIRRWLPVNVYVGGAEHATKHLLYARFITKFLYDEGYLDFDEPFQKFFANGLIYYRGAKMSKSRGNVVNPDVMVEKYGADTIRLYELFMGPASQHVEWSDKGVRGCRRFLERVWQLREKVSPRMKNQDKKLEKIINNTIREVTGGIEQFRFNVVISKLMILSNTLEKEKEIFQRDYEILLKLLSPFAPHITEELWEKLGHKKSIFLEKWPSYNPNLFSDENILLLIQVNGKLRDKISISKNLSEEEVKKLTLEREKVRKWIEGKSIKKVIIVPQKLINIVTD